jgi:hypothetical protein
VVRDIINGSAFQSAIADALEGLPPALQRHRPALKTYFHRTADQHDSILKAHRRKADPAWAQRKFDEGMVLYRFNETDREHLVSAILSPFSDLAKVAEMERGTDRNMAQEAKAFLKGLAHKNDGLHYPGNEARYLIERANLATIRARRHEILRETAMRMAGSLVGSRCTSLAAIIRLGWSAENCLSKSSHHWKAFVSGTVDFWSLHDDARLVAVLAVKRASNQVIEARGRLNRRIALRHIHDVALFCRKAGFSISERCVGLLAEYAECPVLGPKIVILDDCVAEYAEWSNAVRIDIEGEEVQVEEWPFPDTPTTVSLAFDPSSSCAREILDGRDPRGAISAFGSERLRKIVKAIAMNETTPTLVQHRLLALAA